MASSEALSMPHQVMHDASSGVAAKFIKTDKNNHQNHVLNWVGLLRSGTDILEEDVAIVIMSTLIAVIRIAVAFSLLRCPLVAFLFGVRPSYC